MGPATIFPMLFGAVVGWGFLSPLAKKKGWAPGLASDLEGGSRGWVAWIALVIMLTDALINLCWFVGKTILRFAPGMKSLIIQLSAHGLPTDIFVQSSRTGRQSYTPISRRTSSDSVPSLSLLGYWPSDNMLEDASPEHLTSNTTASVMFALSH